MIPASIISRIRVISLTGTLTHTGKHRYPVIRFGDIVDQFLDQYGFTYPGTTEQPDFTTFA